jgi:hypothetical protein
MPFAFGWEAGFEERVVFEEEDGSCLAWEGQGGLVERIGEMWDGFGFNYSDYLN